MNILWILAHPEPRSLNGALRDAGIKSLIDLGHDYRESDLYAMEWRPTVESSDFTAHPPEQPLLVPRASELAHRTGTLSPDIRAEHEKLAWADAIVFQFPLWWFSVPAILKGWFDRVLVKGFGYGVTDPENSGRTARYGEGELAGKRALAVVTAGGPEPAFGPGGINGELDQVLFPLLHGTLFYTGLSVLPPLAVHGSDRFTPSLFDAAARQLHERLATIESTEPLPFRHQNGGDYGDHLVLRPGLSDDSSGLAVHWDRTGDLRNRTHN